MSAVAATRLALVGRKLLVDDLADDVLYALTAEISAIQTQEAELDGKYTVVRKF